MLCAIIRVSIAVQKHRGLNIQGMEFSRSSEGFKLVCSLFGFKYCLMISFFFLPSKKYQRMFNHIA